MQTMINIILAIVAVGTWIFTWVQIAEEKKNIRFNAYFERKVDAYNNYIASVSEMLFSHTGKYSGSASNAFSATTYQAMLFAPSSIIDGIIEVNTTLLRVSDGVEIASIASDARDSMCALIDEMKADLKATESGHFSL